MIRGATAFHRGAARPADHCRGPVLPNWAHVGSSSTKVGAPLPEDEEGAAAGVERPLQQAHHLGQVLQPPQDGGLPLHVARALSLVAGGICQGDDLDGAALAVRPPAPAGQPGVLWGSGFQGLGQPPTPCGWCAESRRRWHLPGAITLAAEPLPSAPPAPAGQPYSL